MDALRMTTQAAEEYLQVGVTTASAGGMPTPVAKLLGLLSRLNQFPQRVALFPLFEEIGDDLFAGSVMLDDFAGGRVSVPRVKIIADGVFRGIRVISPSLTTCHSRATLTIGVIPRWRGKNCFVKSPGSMSGASRWRFTAMETLRSMTDWTRLRRPCWRIHGLRQGRSSSMPR